jgi:hypothetical protein
LSVAAWPAVASARLRKDGSVAAAAAVAARNPRRLISFMPLRCTYCPWVVRPIHLSAHWMKYFMLGASVWPPSCCRHGKLPIEQTLVHRRHFGRAVVPLYCESHGSHHVEDPAGVDRGHKAALVVEPLGVTFLGNAIADEGEPGSAERNSAWARRFVDLSGRPWTCTGPGRTSVRI